jgi:hypothetical protein
MEARHVRHLLMFAWIVLDLASPVTPGVFSLYGDALFIDGVSRRGPEAPDALPPRGADRAQDVRPTAREATRTLTGPFARPDAVARDWTGHVVAFRPRRLLALTPPDDAADH